MVHMKHWLLIFTLILLCLIFYYKLSITDMILARGDTYNYFYPYREISNTVMRSGNFPLWSPDIFMGIPLLANPQLGTFYPPNWLTIAFSAPDAICISILLHVIWAGAGVYVLFRRVVQPAMIPALIAAIVFALGGYVSAHVEQINQLQGIAWLAWLLYLFHRLQFSLKPLRWLILLSIAWALQIFSGHTQTVFMSGIAVGIYALFSTPKEEEALKKLIRHLVLLASATVLAILLAMPQLLPTLELTGMSNRGGGFDANQATAFSLPPTYIGQALLPGYDGQLFTEYIAYAGVVALGLALYGALSPADNRRQRTVWIALALVGLVFAMGRFTPVYWYIAGLPGFNLFRVPARWLALYSLGVSMLAGYGLLVLQQKGIQWKRALIVSISLIILMGLGRILPVLQTDIVGSAQPMLKTLFLWGISLLLLIIIFSRAKHRQTSSLALIFIGVELFLASQILPYNDPVPADVYSGQRFTISQMLAFNEGQTPPSRMLAISARLFDPGDVGTLQARYQNYGLDENASQIALTAIKNQEVLFPNLGLTWEIPTIDGYGGGVLPTIYYSQFTSLLLPEDSLRTVDGRIGEMMTHPACRGACIPGLAYLQLTNTDYIIADKNFDVPHNGIFYDTSLAEYWFGLAQQPDFVFDEVSVLLSEESVSQQTETFQFLGTSYYLTSLSWDEFSNLVDTESELILGASAVNSRTDTFYQLTPAGFERVLSSDIKIYRLESSSRLGLADDIVITSDDWDGHEAALGILRESPDTLVVHDAPVLPGTASGSAEINEYSATRVSVTVNSESETYLYLADAYYPGWRATVNGEDSPVYRANVMFRAVAVPAGESTVIFEFVPRLWYNAMIFGALIWIASIMLLFSLSLRKNP